MRKGPIRLLFMQFALLSVWAATPGRAQAPNSLAEPIYQQRLEQLDLASFTPRLTAMGGVFAGVDDPNNLINLWTLDRNPAALIENYTRPSVEILGFDTHPRTSMGPAEGQQLETGYETQRFGGALFETRYRNRAAALGELSYRAFDSQEDAGDGLWVRNAGNGPRLGLTVGQRTGKLYYGASVNAYNVDESRGLIYDPAHYDSVAINKILLQPELATDRVSYHNVAERLGLQFEATEALRVGVTLGFEQQRISGATSNERMQLDAINDHSLLEGSVGATYRYRDKVALSGRFFHSGYDNTETFRFSRRKAKAQTDPPVVYNGQVADRRYRDRELNARGTWRVDPKYLQLGFSYAKAKTEHYSTTRVGAGSFNYLDSLYLQNSALEDSIGISGGPLIDNGNDVADYVQWTLGAQVHPNPSSTVAADFSRYTASQLTNSVPSSPDYKYFRVGGEYVFQGRLAVRAGYNRIMEDDDRNNPQIDKRKGHEVSLGLGYTPQARRDLELVYLTGNLNSDFADPSHRIVQEHGLRLYGRMFF